MVIVSYGVIVLWIIVFLLFKIVLMLGVLCFINSFFVEIVIMFMFGKI